MPVIAHGEFDNEFIRISILFISLTFAAYSYLSWFLRIIAVVLHIFVILAVEMPYLRELLLQTACYDAGKLPLVYSFDIWFFA